MPDVKQPSFRVILPKFYQPWVIARMLEAFAYATVGDQLFEPIQNLKIFYGAPGEHTIFEIQFCTPDVTRESLRYAAVVALKSVCDEMRMNPEDVNKHVDSITVNYTDLMQFVNQKPVTVPSEPVTESEESKEDW